MALTRGLAAQHIDLKRKQIRMEGSFSMGKGGSEGCEQERGRSFRNSKRNQGSETGDALNLSAETEGGRNISRNLRKMKFGKGGKARAKIAADRIIRHRRRTLFYREDRENMM